MPKYRVYGILTGSVFLGEYKANSEEEAEKMANDDPDANWYPSLCHQCSGEIEFGDIYETEIDIVEE